MKKLVAFIAVSLLVGTAGAQSPVNAKAPEFTLQDQYDKTIALRQFEDRIVVLIASDREGRTQNPQWQKAVKEKYGDNIVTLGLADVRGVPFFLKGKIRNDLKKDAGSILLDWKGEVFTAYGLTKGVPNIILVDKNGYIKYMYAGSAVPDAVQQLFQEIDKLERQ